jgi:hypothetical protein
MKRRGQFYLIAALVIVGIIAGIVSIYNFAKTSEEKTVVYDLTSEIDYEASQVIDRGIFQNLTEKNLSSQLENITDYYSKVNPGSDLVIVYGNETTLTIIYYNNSESGSVGIWFGGSTISIPLESATKYKTTQEYSPGENINVIIPPNINYNFYLAQGQIFYLVFRKEAGEESYVSRSDPLQEGS